MLKYYNAVMPFDAKKGDNITVELSTGKVLRGAISNGGTLLTEREADPVAHPQHYQGNKIEVIEFIEDQGHGSGFRLGNVHKYIARAGKKDPNNYIQDLEKASWYLRREIEIAKANREGREPVRPNDMAAT